MIPTRNVYRVVQTTTTIGGGPNPAYVLAADHEDAIEWCKRELHKHFPEYKFTLASVALVIEASDFGIVEYEDDGNWGMVKE